MQAEYGCEWNELLFIIELRNDIFKHWVGRIPVITILLDFSRYTLETQQINYINMYES